jgi:hypothetical protein
MRITISPERVAPVLAPFFLTWGATLRFRRHGFDNLRRARAEGCRLVFAIWHDELFPLTYLYRNEGVVAVVSSSRDGEFLARVMDRVGFNLARGSSSRGGLRALISAYRQMQAQERDAVFTVDGPRGPRHEVKPGVVYLAAKARASIMPVRVTMHPRKVFTRAWDRFQLPWPGARCDVHYGRPFSVSVEEGEDGMKRECARVRDNLNRLVNEK